MYFCDILYNCIYKLYRFLHNMPRPTFLYVSNEECTICLCTDKVVFFNNVCQCKHLICRSCIEQIDKCPFCRFEFDNGVLFSIQGIILVYKITDLLYPFNSFTVLPEQYYEVIFSLENRTIVGMSDLWLLTIENRDTHYVYDQHNIIVTNNINPPDDEHFNLSTFNYSDDEDNNEYVNYDDYYLVTDEEYITT